MKTIDKLSKYKLYIDNIKQNTIDKFFLFLVRNKIKKNNIDILNIILILTPPSWTHILNLLLIL